MFELSFGENNDQPATVVPEITNDFDDLRLQIDKLRSELGEVNHGINVVRDHKKILQADRDRIEAAVRQAFMEIDTAKREAETEQIRLLREADKIEANIRDLVARQARELELAQELAALMKLRDELNEICADFDAWANAHQYQMEDIMTIVQAYELSMNGILNANDMGLGKTFETIVALYIIQKMFEDKYNRPPRIIWLTKKSLAIRSTPNEIKRWWPKAKIAVIDGAMPIKQREDRFELAMQFNATMFITNYETIRTTKVIAEVSWDIVIIDEVHKLKGGANLNGPTAIWTAIKDLCAKSKFVMMLSGTPMVNRVGEMWAYLHVFKPEAFPSVKQFENAYGVVKSFNAEGAMRIDADKMLNMALKGQVIRRRRDEVGIDLPELNVIVRELNRNEKQEEVYQNIKQQFHHWLDSQTVLTINAVIAQLTRLRQINVWPVFDFKNQLSGEIERFNIPDSSKLDETMDIIQEMNDIDEQVVVFSNFNEPMFELKRRCNEAGISCEIIYGETGGNNYEERFQQKKLDVLLINLAMGEGLNLQKNPDFWPGGSRTGIFLDQWWNPSRNDQAIARLYRQGANQPVDIIVLRCTPSVDHFIAGLCEMKQAEFDAIMESDQLRPNLREMLGDI